MKKMVLVTTNCEVSVIDYPVDKPDDYMAELRGFYNAISCDCIEIVNARYLNPILNEDTHLVMVVDEEGLMNIKRLNIVGSLFYGTHEHGNPIVGDILIMTQEITFDGPALAGLDEAVAESVAAKIRDIVSKNELGEAMDE